jgi:hypothetical protein
VVSHDRSPASLPLRVFASGKIGLALSSAAVPPGVRGRRPLPKGRPVWPGS